MKEAYGHRRDPERRRAIERPPREPAEGEGEPLVSYTWPHANVGGKEGTHWNRLRTSEVVDDPDERDDEEQDVGEREGEHQQRRLEHRNKGGHVSLAPRSWRKREEGRENEPFCS